MRRRAMYRCSVRVTSQPRAEHIVEGGTPGRPGGGTAGPCRAALPPVPEGTLAPWGPLVLVPPATARTHEPCRSGVRVPVRAGGLPVQPGLLVLVGEGGEGGEVAFGVESGGAACSSGSDGLARCRRRRRRRRPPGGDAGAGGGGLDPDKAGGVEVELACEQFGGLVVADGDEERGHAKAPGLLTEDIPDGGQQAAGRCPYQADSGVNAARGGS